MNAIGDRKERLAEAIGQFPDFMRQANTTFVNLRAALDDVDPLVDASKPVAVELRPFLAELRAAAADAVPTIRDLDAIVKRRGPDNDLVELDPDPAAADRASRSARGSPDCGPGTEDPEDLEIPADDDFTQGAFGEAVCSLTNGETNLEFFRAYTPELVGWFDDFGHSGAIDALRRHRPDRDDLQRLLGLRTAGGRSRPRPGRSAADELARLARHRQPAASAARAATSGPVSASTPATTRSRSPTAARSPTVSPATATRATCTRPMRRIALIARRARRRRRRPRLERRRRRRAHLRDRDVQRLRHRRRARTCGSPASTPARSPTSTSTPPSAPWSPSSSSGELGTLGEDTECSSEPQSLIAEYFINCEPTGPPTRPRTTTPTTRTPTSRPSRVDADRADRPRPEHAARALQAPPAADHQRVRHRARRQRREPQRGDPARRPGAAPSSRR